MTLRENKKIFVRTLGTRNEVFNFNGIYVNARQILLFIFKGKGIVSNYFYVFIVLKM